MSRRKGVSLSVESLSGASKDITMEETLSDLESIVGVSPSEVARELARRELARRRLHFFIRYTFPEYVARPHNRLIADAVDLVLCGYWRRLMIFCPPQYGKSEIVSRRTPPFYLGKNPDKGIILTSYSADLAHALSREARAIIMSNLYKNVFESETSGRDISLSDDAKSVKFWRISGHRGGLLATGVGGGITGHRADLLIIDDPVKDNEEATSEKIREMHWQWYWSSAFSRLAPDGGVILCMTRWHEDDLAGRLLATQHEYGDYWYVLRLPALAEESEEIEKWCKNNNVDVSRWVTRDLVDYSLEKAGLVESKKTPPAIPFGSELARASSANITFHAPPVSSPPYEFKDPLGRVAGMPLDSMRHDVEELYVRKNSNPRVWGALWQQDPHVLGAGLIDVSKIVILPLAEVPAKNEMKVLVRAWDFAYGKRELSKTHPDFTVGALLGLWYHHGTYYVILYDIKRWRTSWPETRRRFFDVAQEDGRDVVILIESGGAQKALFEDLRSSPELRGYKVRGVLPLSDKVARAQVWAAEIEAQRFLLAPGHWNTAFLDECRAFDRGAYDDQVDAISLAYSFLSPMMRSTPVVRVPVRGLYK
ncbi:MAG: phage terminase large subunit [Candidatus Methanomethylicaceae archaeon]